MTDPAGPDAERRLAALEATVAGLASEVAALRAEMGARAAAPAPALRPAPRPAPRAAPPPAPPRKRLWHVDLDLEALVGRYGTMLLGALTILLGVGAFLRWAIQRVTIGPELRVALGALGAAGVGALGLWLRQRGARGDGTGGAGARRFGDVLLALSLALVHVVAWGAGPGLEVVHPAVALAVATAASVALATLAWRSQEQPLFVVGVGGALLAPFVTAGESGNPLVLLGYGLLVITTSVLAQRDRDWPWARRVLGLGVATYVGAALAAGYQSWPRHDIVWLRRGAPVVFVLACAATALAAGGRAARSTLARQWLLLLAVPLIGAVSFDAGDLRELYVVALALLGTLGVYLALRLPDARQTLAVPSALVQPALLLVVILPAFPRSYDGGRALTALLWAAVALLAAFGAGAGPRLAGGPVPTTPTVPPGAATPAGGPRALWDIHLLVAGLLAVLATGLATRDVRLLGAAAFAAVGVATALLVRRTGVPLLLLTPLVALFMGSGWAFSALGARPAFEYTPFLSLASLATAAVVAGWWVAGALVANSVVSPAVGATERRLLAALGPVAAFLWGYVELARAFSPDLADFLLILYLALAGVLCIALGRRRAVPGGRKVGLGLAIWAALLALVEASDFEAVGLRVGAYLMVGVFLLGVAYWYRAAGEVEGTPAPAPDPAPRPAHEPS